MFTPGGRAAAALLALSLLLSPAAAAADEPSAAEIAAARQLFNEAKDLEKQSAWGEARAKLEKVAGVKMTPQVRFHLALCDENLGRLVSAINGFELAADEARRAGAADVAENAPRRAEALRLRVPKVRLEVVGSLGSARLLLDDTVLAKSLVGTEIPVDPGSHAIRVESTSGKVLFETEVTLAERDATPIAIEVEEEEEAPPPIAAKAAPPAPPPAPAPSRAPAVAVGVVGALSLVGAGVFYGLREGAIADVRASCEQGDAGCDPRMRQTADDGQTYTTVSAVLLGAGAAGLATAGVLWFVLAPKKGNAASLGVSPGAGRLCVAGSF